MPAGLIENIPEVEIDARKAMMSPYVARLALRFMDTDAHFLHLADDLSNKTSTGAWDFLDQSPDTRPVTFEAAVACESEHHTESHNTDFFIEEINREVANGVEIFCPDLRWTLYYGDCRYHRYWNALK